MPFIGRRLNHAVNIVLGNYFFGLLSPLLIAVCDIIVDNTWSVLFAVSFFVALHAILVLLQAITLNVAFNSQNKMLLIIMLTNNVSLKMRFDEFNPLDNLL